MRAAALLLLACTSSPASLDGELGAAERQIVGLADPYPADRSLRAREDLLKRDWQARRALGWQIVEKALTPVRVQDAALKIMHTDVPTLPRFETWYQKDELRSMFKQLYADHGVEKRRAKAPFTDVQIANVMTWNANRIVAQGLPEELYTGRLAKVKEEADLSGLTAAESIGFAPAAVAHLFKNYHAILGCVQPLNAGSSASLLDQLTPRDAPLSDENFTRCYDSEFPADAAVTKAYWANRIASPTLPTYDTGPNALAAHLTSGDGGWGAGEAAADPGPEAIHTARLEDGTLLRLAGLHVMTKELRHWVWVTLWWSTTPDADFGADRPEAIRKLGGPWSHYKMAVVVSDMDGDAPTWASNPYIEHGPMNARSNCIGCHQHAGTPLDPGVTLSDEAAYPLNGRKLVRNNFPADYLWVFDKKSRVARIIQSVVDTQDQRDAQY